jgi:hypothetical protein
MGSKMGSKTRIGRGLAFCLEAQSLTGPVRIFRIMLEGQLIKARLQTSAQTDGYGMASRIAVHILLLCEKFFAWHNRRVAVIGVDA